MQTPSPLNRFSQTLISFFPFHRFSGRRAILPLASLTLGVWLSGVGQAQAQSNSPEPAPPAEVSTLLSQIDSAASQQDIEAVMQFYSSDFSSTDGLTYTSLEDALETFWERFSTVRYQTSLNSWEQEGNALIIETTTQITGAQEVAGRDLNLTATITSRQTIEAGQIIQQEILAEESQLTTGDNPPDVTINLPDRVTVSQEFSFDAIVEEPLGDRYLLGAVLEEPIQAATLTDSPDIELELLAAGGLFKIGRAPLLADDRWISAVLVREDGMILITRRLQVAERP